MSIGERVKKRRQELGMSVEELARRVGLRPTTLYDLERGDSKGTKRLHRIAVVLRCSIRWLEDGKGSLHATPEEVLLAVGEEQPSYGWPFRFNRSQWDKLTSAQRDQIERLVLLLMRDFDDGGLATTSAKKASRRR